MSDANSINNFLEKFGLSEKEIQIYLSLLELGASTIMDISRHTSIKRSTTHNNVEELIKKGLVSQTIVGERRMVIAEDPEKLSFIMEQKQWELKKLEDKLPAIISQITNSIPNLKQNINFEVRYYKGKKEVGYIYDQALKSNELRAYVNAMEVAKVFPNNMNKFIEVHNKQKNLKIWEIMNESPRVVDYAKKMGPDRYFYKFIPKSMNLSVIDYMIFDGKVAIITIKENASGLLISNEEFYENSKAIFNFVWDMIDKRQ